MIPIRLARPPMPATHRWPRRRALGLLALAPVLSLGACARSRDPDAPLPEDVAALVEMRFLSFDPEEVHLRVGESVLWRNESLLAHTVTCDPAELDDPSLIERPEGAQPFHSGRLGRGDEFRWRFEVPGLYRYVCLPHRDVGMAGRVVVEAGEPEPMA